MTEEKTRLWDTEVTQSQSGATLSSYSSSASEAPQISDSGRCTTANLPIYMESPHRHHLSCRAVSQQGRGGRGCEEQRASAPEAMSVWSHRCLYRQCIRPLSAPGPHLLQHSPPLGQRSWCGEREKHTLKGNRVSSGPTPERVVTATEQRGSPTSHPPPALALTSPATPATKVIAASTP